MGSILVAMPKSEDANRIVGIIQSGGMMLDTEICSSGSEVLRIANERDYGVVICMKKLRDMNYPELSEYLPANFSMIVLTSDSSMEVFSDKVVKLVLPFKRGELLSTIEMMTQNFYRQRKKKNKPPRERSEEEKQTIDKAKAILMERNGMTEPEAFRYIQKTSMDYGRSAVETAQMILLMHDQ